MFTTYKKRLLILLSAVLAAMLVLACACMLVPKTTAYASPTNTATIDFGDGITFDDESATNELITVLGGTSYDDLSTQLENGVKDASNFASAKTVTLGGVEFNIMYVSKADYTANGTNAGDIIVTLWMTYANRENSIELKWNSVGSNTPEDKYPANMYSSSLIRSKLAGSNYLNEVGAETLDGTGEIYDAWKPFVNTATETGAFYNYLATPANMAWQETLSAVDILSSDYNFPNEAWGTPSGGSFTAGFDYSEKTEYFSWKNDRLWLPAYSEIGENTQTGLWNTTQAQRSNNASIAWLRSGNESNASSAYVLNGFGEQAYTNNFQWSFAIVRPAVHLNLTSLNKFEVTTDGTATKYCTIEGAFSAANGASSAATVKMFADATTTATLTVAEGKDITLNLNGHMLKNNSSASVVTVKGDLTLIDSNPQAEHKYNINDNGLWIFNDSGTETLNGGVITGGYAAAYSGGGGVLVDGGKFTMSGGAISGNRAIANVCGGGGVGVFSGTFEMKDGKICGNFADGGGGVAVDGGKFIMTGGEISGNNVFEYGGGVLVKTGEFEMTGGTISGNTADCGAGGVLVFGGTFKISGDPYITGNKADDSDDNVYLLNDTIITVAGELKEGAKIGVGNTGAVATGFKQSDKPSNYFIADGANQCVYVSDETSGEITIAETHNWDNAPWLSDESIHWQECQNGCGREELRYTHNYTEEVVSDTYLKSAATCTEKAIYYKSCECGAHGTETFENGEVLGHTLTHNEATAATEEKDGNTEYWSCDECGKYFEDEAGENEITDKTSVVISKLTPETPAPDNSGSDKTPSATAPAEEKKSYWWLFLLLIPIAIGAGGVTFGIYEYKKKKENNG